MGGPAKRFSGSSGGEGGTLGGVWGCTKKTYSVVAILFLIFVDASLSSWELTMNTGQSWHALVNVDLHFNSSIVLIL